MGSGSKQSKKRGRSAKLSESLSKSTNDCSDQSEVSNSSSTPAQSSTHILSLTVPFQEVRVIRSLLDSAHACNWCIQFAVVILRMSQVLEGFTTVFLVEHFVTTFPSIEKQLSLSQELNQTLLKRYFHIQKTTETNIQTKTVDFVKQPLNPMAPPF